MPRDKTESHLRIRQVAKAEFLEKGFEAVSMREIAGKVGLTPAALYRHYPSKEAMFNDLVEPLMAKLTELATHHQTEAYRNFDATGNGENMVKDNAVEITKSLMKEYPEELRLVVCCSHGTKYQNFIHDLVKIETEETGKAFTYMRAQGIPVKEIGEDEIHVLMSAYLTAILEPIAHGWPMEKAVKCLDLLEEFFVPGWKNIMGFC